jgi:phosphate transport system protein
VGAGEQMPERHTIRAYDDELSKLGNMIISMGALAESQLEGALRALSTRDSDLAAHIVASDNQVDQIDADVDLLAVRILALRQPMADDLRMIVGALRISSTIERIADYSANIAKRVLVLNQMPSVGPAASVVQLGQRVQILLKSVLDAFINQNSEEAIKVWRQDEEVDRFHTVLTHKLTEHMSDNPRSITACMHLTFIAKNIERIGDLATNIAESIHYQVKGTRIQEPRAKGDSVPLDP